MVAYNTNKLRKKALEAIKANGLVFVYEVFSFIGISKQTFYDHHLDESDEINTALAVNRNKIKASLRSKWYNSDNATTQIALYRLIANDEEFTRLTAQKVEHSGEMKSGITVNVIQSEIPIAEREEDVTD